MLKKYFVRISTLILLCFAAISVANAGSENLLQVDLSFEKSVFGFNETIPAQVKISNPNANDIKILRWLTPVDGVNGNLFSVTLNGKAVEYTGALFKRAAPTEADYLTLKPGETIVNSVNLADYYDLSQNGYYQIAYQAESYDLSATEPMFQQKAEKLKSPSVAVWIYGTAKKMPPNVPTADYATTGCNAAQTPSLPAATNSALGYAVNAYSYLNAGTVNARYTTWFGAFDPTRYATVRTHFLNIRNLLAADTYRIACNDPNCQPSYYAFVYPTDTATHTIYVCNVFFTAPTTGTDSKAGTLVHEMSHFNDIAATNDFVYGQSGAMSLAISNPGNAIMNADNHEYFGEAGSPTAAAVSISGRVTTIGGRGIVNVRLSLIDSQGNVRTATSTAFGYYRFNDVEAGQTCIISAIGKRYTFSRSSQVLNVTDELTEINFTGSNDFK